MFSIITNIKNDFSCKQACQVIKAILEQKRNTQLMVEKIEEARISLKNGYPDQTLDLKEKFKEYINLIKIPNKLLFACPSI